MVIATYVSPAGFLALTVNALLSISAMGLPVISPVSSFSVRPSGSGVLSYMKNSVMRFR